MTLIALVADAHEQPIPGVDVAFSVVGGLSSVAQATTGSNGLASSIIVTSRVGTSSVLQASFIDSSGATQISNQVQITWIDESVLP